MSLDPTTQPVQTGSRFAADLETRIELGIHAFKHRQFEEAITQAELVRQDSTLDPRAMSLQSACQIMTGDIESGFEILGQLYNRMPIEEYCDVIDELAEHVSVREDGYAMIQWQDFLRCVTFLCTPEFIDPGNTLQWEMMVARLQSAQPLMTDDFETAIANLLLHLRAYPDDVEARYLLGDTYGENGQPYLARELFYQVLDRDPHHAYAISQLARLAAIDGDFEKAIELGIRSVEELPEDHRSAFNLGLYFMEDRQFENAIKMFEDIYHCPCVEFECLGNLVDCFRELQQYDLALEMCEKAIQYDPEIVSRNVPFDIAVEFARINRIICFSKLQRDAEAHSAFEELLNELPESVEDKAEIGNIFLDQGEFEFGCQVLRAAQLVHPDNLDLHIDLAIAENLAGNPDIEIEILQSILTCDPDHPVAHLNLGATLCNLGRLEEAVYHGEKALELGDVEGANWNLATTFAKQGNKTRCLQHLQAAIAENNSYIGMAVTDPDLASYANDPRFQEIVNRSRK